MNEEEQISWWIQNEVAENVIKQILADRRRIKELEAELKVAQSFHKVAIQQRDAANKRITELEAQAAIDTEAKNHLNRCLMKLEARLEAMEQAYEEGITYGQFKAALGGDDGRG